jgi:hypothetical protein
MPHNVYTGDEEGRVVRHSSFLPSFLYLYIRCSRGEQALMQILENTD